MDIGKYLSGFFTHTLTRSVNDNQNSFEDRESYFLLVLKKNDEGKKIYQIIRESEEFNIYELKDLNNPVNLIYLVISLKFTNERVSSKAEELQPSRDNNLFWGDWPPSYSWVFFLGNILFNKIKESTSWENCVDNIIALHNGESLFDIFEKSTKFIGRNGVSNEIKQEITEYYSFGVNETNQYSSIPKLFNIICEWCDYFGPNIMTTFWLLIVNFVVTVIVFFTNSFGELTDTFILFFSFEKALLFNPCPYFRYLTPYLILFIPVISSTGLIFLKSILDDFPLPKHKQRDLIYLSSNCWRKKNKSKFDFFCLFNIIWISLMSILISIFITNYYITTYIMFFQFIANLIASLITLQALNILETKTNATRETYETLWSLKLRLIFKNLFVFLYWLFVKRFSVYLNRNSIDYFPFALTLIIFARNVIYISFSLPFSKKTIGFKLGPKEELKRIPLGDYIYCFNETATEKRKSLVRNIWDNLFIFQRSTLYEDLWYYNLINTVLLSISTGYPILSPLLLIINTLIVIVLMFSKILTDSTRPWLLNVTLSYQLWKFVFDTSILFSISFFSSTPTSSNLKTFLFLITFTLYNINFISSKSGKIVYLSENLVLYIFKIIPLFKYTKQVIIKNRTSLNKAINKVLRRRTAGILGCKIDVFNDYLLQKNREVVNSSKPIELSNQIQELLEKFKGYWVLLRSNSDSLQEINAALGVSWFIRRAVDKLNPIVHYDVDKVKGIVTISTTLIMGLNDRTTLIITKTKMLGKSDFDEIEKTRIEQLKNEDFDEDFHKSQEEEVNRQFSNKRKRSLDRFLVIDQPSTTFEWNDDKTNVILETRQNREGFKMIETRSVIPLYKLPFKIKGNDGKMIDSKHKEILCHKVILKGRKNGSTNKSNLLVCCRYFIRTELKIPNSKFNTSKESIRALNKSFKHREHFSNQDMGEQGEELHPNFLGDSDDFPISVGEISQREDELLEIVFRKRDELLEKTRKLVKEIDGGSLKWTLERNSNGMKVYKKEINEQPFMSCGVTSIMLNTGNSELDMKSKNKITSIKDIVDYIWDSNNKMYYDPMVEKSDPMHYFRNDENICIFYQAFKGQWGVSGRDFVVICYRYKPSIDELSCPNESKYEYLLTQSVEWPTINSTYVRARNYFATYVFRPEGENKIQALYFNQVDLHTDISTWIIKRVILDQMNSLTMLRDILQKKT